MEEDFLELMIESMRGDRNASGYAHAITEGYVHGMPNRDSYFVEDPELFERGLEELFQNDLIEEREER